ncbi:unnamed protein product, partial [Oikopleura dioica]
VFNRYNYGNTSMFAALQNAICTPFRIETYFGQLYK